MINRYTIYGGHRDMKVDVLFDRPLKQEVFAAGVQILKEGGHMSDHKGLTGSWGNRLACHRHHRLCEGNNRYGNFHS